MTRQDYYCVYCMQNFEAKEFSVWLEDTTKARKCNGCQDEEKVSSMIESNNIERDLKREAECKKITPILLKLSSSEESKRKVEVSRRLQEKREQMRLDDYIGI